MKREYWPRMGQIFNFRRYKMQNLYPNCPSTPKKKRTSGHAHYKRQAFRDFVTFYTFLTKLSSIKYWKIAKYNILYDFSFQSWILDNPEKPCF